MPAANYFSLVVPPTVDTWIFSVYTKQKSTIGAATTTGLEA
jgi:hypothetical protein